MVDAVGTGALLAADSGPELPTVNDFLPPEILFQGTPFAINRIILIRIVATVVLEPGATSGQEQLREFVRAKLRSSRTPDRIVFRTELPSTLTGKILRRNIVADILASTEVTPV